MTHSDDPIHTSRTAVPKLYRGTTPLCRFIEPSTMETTPTQPHCVSVQTQHTRTTADWRSNHTKRLHSAHKTRCYRHSDKLFWSVSPCVRPSQPRPQRRLPQRHSIHFEDTGDTLYHTQPCPAYLYLIHRLEYLSIPSTTTEQQQCRITRPHCATVCHGSPPSCARAPMLRPSPTDTTHTSEFGAKVIREIRQQKNWGQEALCMAP